jgi:serine/threonine-protein kinase
VLPFTGIVEIGGVAVDTAGNVYIAEVSHKQVLKLAAR